MSTGFQVRSFRFAGLTAALLAGLVFVSNGLSQPQPGAQTKQKDKQKDQGKGQGKGKGKGKGKADPVEKAIEQDVKGKESHVLKEAYILMAMANHNYAGHRGNAMKQVETAIEMLDRSILKNGTNGQKVVALQEEIIAARAAFIAKLQGKNHEPQVLSDLQMNEAGRLLLAVHSAMVQHPQPKVREHVDNAIKQIDIALKIR